MRVRPSFGLQSPAHFCSLATTGTHADLHNGRRERFAHRSHQRSQDGGHENHLRRAERKSRDARRPMEGASMPTCPENATTTWIRRARDGVRLLEAWGRFAVCAFAFIELVRV